MNHFHTGGDGNISAFHEFGIGHASPPGNSAVQGLCCTVIQNEKSPPGKRTLKEKGIGENVIRLRKITSEQFPGIPVGKFFRRPVFLHGKRAEIIRSQTAAPFDHLRRNRTFMNRNIGRQHGAFYRGCSGSAGNKGFWNK